MHTISIASSSSFLSSAGQVHYRPTVDIVGSTSRACYPPGAIASSAASSQSLRVSHSTASASSRRAPFSQELSAQSQASYICPPIASTGPRHIHDLTATSNTKHPQVTDHDILTPSRSDQSYSLYCRICDTAKHIARILKHRSLDDATRHRVRDGNALTRPVGWPLPDTQRTIARH